MAGKTLYDKIWQSHSVGTLPTGQTQLFIGLHLIHEITTAPAFDMLREAGMDIAFPERTFATVDHIVPTDLRKRPFGEHESRHCSRDRPATRFNAARNDARMRRQPHEHAWRFWHIGFRHRHESGA
jgi:homoaconitase/3-isopropylmalate dehydratase large subunit